MSLLLTRCPRCQASFELSEEELDSGHGAVRCGFCGQIFNAKHHLFELEHAQDQETPIPTIRTFYALPPALKQSTKQDLADPKTTPEATTPAPSVTEPAAEPATKTHDHKIVMHWLAPDPNARTEVEGYDLPDNIRANEQALDEASLDAALADESWRDLPLEEEEPQTQAPPRKTLDTSVQWAPITEQAPKPLAEDPPASLPKVSPDTYPQQESPVDSLATAIDATEVDYAAPASRQEAELTRSLAAARHQAQKPPLESAPTPEYTDLDPLFDEVPTKRSPDPLDTQNVQDYYQHVEQRAEDQSYRHPSAYRLEEEAVEEMLGSPVDEDQIAPQPLVAGRDEEGTEWEAISAQASGHNQLKTKTQRQARKRPRTKEAQPWWRTLMWPLIAGSLISLLLVFVIWFWPEPSQECQGAGCQTALVVKEVALGQHPSQDNLLLVELELQNLAERIAPAPRLEVILFNLNQRMIDTYYFAPTDYLPTHLQKFIPEHGRISLTVAVPKPSALVGSYRARLSTASIKAP
ncbi:MJ0042 family finger-like domain-containing protein [Allopseudospirillum japonicum]|uniref:MJ0042 family finger-like domain-containing protein n=1 Tax=Allopseudospirillum japonicum TaxID=64971 RepID=A0A1H6QFK1_9GAMM|nr:DUF3426 domain-containing protein [Allopseudospirillum japonicum]SEI42448.1 MJ0042 family finger-like domain-containing protein [Allopseudospirillum japonicum]